MDLPCLGRLEPTLIFKLRLIQICWLSSIELARELIAYIEPPVNASVQGRRGIIRTVVPGALSSL